ncbi:hypothetical protein TIFTF001_025350 [Ficus carica]|uniref:Uncharacterized protein n=1 Tax=Ficus carica TaxID=3494 RepID=A0AA88AJN8_FICCA|nr:hypothetical protein TIFTF001_025350 [Ficus carica]
MDELTMVSSFARFFLFVHPDSIPICLLLGLVPTSAVETWFGDEMVDPG